MTKEIRCYLYWIRNESMKDIFKEGYVGISTTPNVRILQHISNARTDSHHKYPEGFRDCLLSGAYVFQVMLCSTIGYCLDIERKLRPKLYIGWNRAIGGDGGVVYKHGLTGSKLAKTYYNLLTRSCTEDEEFFAEWRTEDGLLRFSEFYKLWEFHDGEFTLREKGLGYCPANLVKLTRSEIIRKAYKRYDIGEGDQIIYSVEDLAEKFNMQPNKISSRMRNGWTVREAVGLDEKIKRGVLDAGGNLVPYIGKLKQCDFDLIKETLDKGMSLQETSKLIGMSASNLSRLVTKMGYIRGIKEHA